MILEAYQIEMVEAQIDAQLVPQDNAVISDLEERYGVHSFFINADGLLIFEPAGITDNGRDQLVTLHLATWDDEVEATLVPKNAPERGQVLDIPGKGMPRKG